MNSEDTREPRPIQPTVKLADLTDNLRTLFGVEVNEKGLKDVKRAFYRVGEQNYEDFASMVYLELWKLKSIGRHISNQEVTRACWRCAKSIQRQIERTPRQPTSSATEEPEAKHRPKDNRLDQFDVALFTESLDPEKSTLLLLLLQGYSLSEAAARLGISPATATRRAAELRVLMKRRFRA
jgi:hypothetical protein